MYPGTTLHRLLLCPSLLDETVVRTLVTARNVKEQIMPDSMCSSSVNLALKSPLAKL